MGPAALPCHQHLSSRSSTAALRSALSSASHCLATSRSGHSGIARTTAGGRPLGGDAGAPDLLHTLHGLAVISPCMPQQPLPGRAPRRLRSQHHGGGNGGMAHGHHHGGGASNSSSHGATDNRVVDQLVAPSHPFLIADQAQGPSPQEVQDMLPLLTPKQLADAIWGFAKHDIKPDVDFMDAIALEIKSKLPYFRSQDLSNTLWALGMLKHQPAQDWWEEFDRQVYKHLTDFSDRELANLLWGFAVLGQRQAWVLDNVLSVASDNFESYSANSLHLIIWSLGKLSYVPSSDWLHSYLKATQANFFQFSPSEMANIIWALAKLGVRLPSMWLDNFLMVAQWRFPNFGAKLLSIVVWSCASLDHRPSQEWLVCFEQQVREKFNEFSGHELACVAWALRKFGYTNEHNAVFYMLDQQEQFLNVDFEILANSKLLRQVLGWRRDYNAGSSSTTGEA